MIDRKELVEKMLAAYSIGYTEGPISRQDSERLGMDAALSVAIEELLRDVTVAEKAFVPNAYYSKALLDSRRAQLERVKTPEEQIADLIVARFGAGTLPAQKLAAEIINLLPKNQ